VLKARSLELFDCDAQQTRVWMRPDAPPPAAKPERVAEGSSPDIELRTRPARESEGPPPIEVFALIRRIALQRDLANATGVLHAGLGELLSAHVVLAQILDGGAITSPVISDLRAAAKLVPLATIAECHRRKQRFVAERLVMVPLNTTTPTVLVVWRTPRHQGFDAAALRLLGQAAVRLAVLDHFLALAAQNRAQAAADQKSVFRAEALAAARGDKRECELVELSPKTLRISIPMLAIVAALLVAAAAIVKVPTYSRGVGVVKMQGVNVISNSSGRVVTKFVESGQQIAKGDPIVELDTTSERQSFEHVDTLYRDQLSAFLFDTTDEAAKQSLAAILAQRKAALDALTAKTILAPCDGTVGEWLAPDTVQAGEQVVTIVTSETAPKIVAYVPGSDGRRLSRGMPMQVELVGYPDSRMTLTITDVGAEPVSAIVASKTFGQKLAGSVAPPPVGVRVEAVLPPGQFESRGKTFEYGDGMEVLVEIEIDTKSFLSVVIPTGE
jgi:multidrug efflux pump subunit AcrA (membrane-fusion protein)